MVINKAAIRVINTIKFGIYIPTRYYKAIELDRINGNTYWQDSTKKKMKNVKAVFKFLDDRSKLPIQFKKITCHLIFDVNFDLTSKSI